MMDTSSVGTANSSLSSRPDELDSMPIASRVHRVSLTQQEVHSAEYRKLEEGITRMTNRIRASHDFHHPAHGTALLLNFMGIIDAALQKRHDDPMTQACYVDDLMPTLRGYLDTIAKWAAFYSNLGPDEVQPEGAQSCH